MSVRWAYGLTTVPQRIDTLLPGTLASLACAGFDKPRLFVDGADGPEPYRKFGLEITTRHPNLRVYGNWILALAELYIREPVASRLAIFQDDFVTCLNLRAYLEHCTYPEKGYWNLYTFPQNQALAEKGKTGWYLSNQRGLGAVALVFSRDAVQVLLAQRHMIDRPANADGRSWRNVDGAIVTAMSQAGYREFVHNPSLVQHLGRYSSMGKRQHPQAVSFMGETFDALELLA